MTYEEALRYMEGLIRFGWKLGNERFEALCERMGNPQQNYAVLHVAGTKGKGSTTALAAAILREARCDVGGYFSPYVYDVRERVQVNGEMIPREDFARLVTLAVPHIEALARTELGQTTEFEIKTLIGFLYFAHRHVDCACIEVGLGGRLDATNIVQPAATIITNIGLDHTNILGDTHALIAAEKAGIIKPGIPCFTATDNPEALDVIRRIALEREAPLTLVRHGDASAPTGNPAEVRWAIAPPPGIVLPQPSGLNPQATVWPPALGLWPQASPALQPPSLHTAPVTIATPTRVYPDLEMRMGGIYQRANAACAIAGAEAIMGAMGQELPEEAVRKALAETSLPGRLTVVELENGPLVVLDGAHNELAAQALLGPIRELRQRLRAKRLLLVVGMVGGHAPEGVLAALAPDAEAVFVSRPNWKRAIPAEEIAAAARRFVPRVEVWPSVPEAVQAALGETRPDDMLLITGSFYTVGEVPIDRLTEWHFRIANARSSGA